MAEQRWQLDCLFERGVQESYLAYPIEAIQVSSMKMGRNSEAAVGSKQLQVNVMSCKPFASHVAKVLNQQSTSQQQLASQLSNQLEAVCPLP